MEFDEEKITDLLETNRFEIVRRLQVDRTFLFDYLRSKNVFDPGDCELVYAEKTRELRAGKFLDILMMKGEAAYDHFVDALQLLNPCLFEKLTGQKATARPNPIMMEMKENFTLANGTTTMDLDIMSNHLKRTIQDLQDITLRYDQVIKSNQELSKNLQEAHFQIQSKNSRLELLEKQIQEGEVRLLEAQTNAQRTQDSFGQKLSIERERYNENNTFIIALQMRLLDYKEQIDGLEKRNSELSSQNDSLKGKLNEICQHYENERRQSLRLTERLETQKSDIERVQETKRKCRELTFQIQQLSKERDDIAEELEQLKNWTEALKVRYDIIKQEKDETLESHETVVADCSSLRDQSYRLELTINQAKRREEDLAKVNKDLEEAVKSYRKQRDLCEQAMKEAIIERDQARIERDECQQRYKKVVDLRDTKINEHMEETKKFEALFEEARKELRGLKEHLQEAENDKQILLVRLMTIETSQPLAALTASPSKQNDEDANSCTAVNQTFNWKDRKTRDIIDSVRKRVQPGLNIVCKSPTSPAESNFSPLSFERESSLDERLAAILPQYDSLSPEAKSNLSLQRNQAVKMLLPYGAIATMCPKLANSSATAYESGRQSASTVTPFSSGKRSGKEENAVSTGEISLSTIGESPEKEKDYYVAVEMRCTSTTSDAAKYGNKKRSPYRRSKSLPPSTMFEPIASNKPVGSESKRDDKQNTEANEKKMWNNTETDQLLVTNNIRSHPKLFKYGPGSQKVGKELSTLAKRENFCEGISAFNVLSPGSETESFTFDEEIIVKRLDFMRNESEESLREVRNALESPSLRAPFRKRAERLSPDERPRSKSANS